MRVRMAAVDMARGGVKIMDKAESYAPVMLMLMMSDRVGVRNGIMG